MKKIPYYLIILFGLLSLGANIAGERLYYSAPSVIPNTIRQMKTAGFWIARQETPDKIMMESPDIVSFNTWIVDDLKLTEDISRIGPVYSGKVFTASIKEKIGKLSAEKLYLKGGGRLDGSFYKDIEYRIGLDAIKPDIDVRYGFVCRYSDQRVLPTDDIVSEEAGDIGFDEFQNNSLDIGVPLAVLHETIDGVWAYAVSPTSVGWIKKENVAFCEKKDVVDYLGRDRFVVVTSGKADIFADLKLTRYMDYVRMGTRFPCGPDQGASAISIAVPCRNKEGKYFEETAYVRREDVSFGYLPYTKRNILQQAFKLLDSPYGWGGRGGEEDCSGFIQEIFMTVGIILPRNSADQGRTGRSLGVFSKKKDNDQKLRVLNKDAIAGASILLLENHIMLYLGEYEGSPYVIHQTHGYRQRAWWGGDIVRAVDRVIVSDLSLGKGSGKGSLLDRVISIRNID